MFARGAFYPDRLISLSALHSKKKTSRRSARLKVIAVFIILYGGVCSKIWSQDVKVIVSPQFGLTASKLHFSISGDMDGKNPNILSELKWEQIRGVELGATVEIVFLNKLVLNLSYRHSSAYSGRVFDRDYANDNRQNIYNDLELSSHIGQMQKLDVSPGFLMIKTSAFSGAIGLNYSQSGKRYYLLDFEDSNEFDNRLNSYYHTNWSSYGIYLLGIYSINENNSLSLRCRGSLSEYRAKANWNLVEEFKKPISFIHKGRGYSGEFELKYSYALTRNLKINAQFFYLTDMLNDGTDQLFLKSGTVEKTKLNEVRSMMLSSSLGFSFGI